MICEHFQVSNKCFRFRPQLDSWSQTNGMIMDREYHAAASLRGFLYVISSESAERFDPTSGTWSIINSLPLTCENLQAVGGKGILYVVGSPQTDDGPGNITLFEYNPLISTWTYAEIDPPEIWSVCPLMTSLNGVLYFLGDDSRHLQSFDPIKRIWTLLPDSKEVHLGGSLTVLDGKVTISGGYASESGLTDTIEQFDPESGQWSIYTRLKEPTFWHGSVAVHKFINPPNSPDYKYNENI
jgi:kelch-like protein 21